MGHRAAGLGLALAVGVLAAGCETKPRALPLLRNRPSAHALDRVEAKLGPAGGTLTVLGAASAIVPEGALTEPTWLGIQRRSLERLAPLPAGYAPLSLAASFLPVAQGFALPVALQLAYREATDAPALQLLRLDDARDASWEPVPESSAAVGVARAAVTRFGIYVVVRVPHAEQVLGDAGLGDGGF